MKLFTCYIIEIIRGKIIFWSQIFIKGKKIQVFIFLYKPVYK